MKEKKMKRLFKLCMIVMLLVPVLPVKAASEKPLPVTVDVFTVDKKTVKQGEKLTYNATISANENLEAEKERFDGENLTRLTIVWQSEGDQKITRSYKWDGSTPLNITDSIQVQKGMQPGKWSVSVITLNFNDMYGIKIYDPRFVNRKTIKGSYSMDLSDGDFSVSGTKADNKAPVVKWSSMKLSKKKVNSSQKSRFSVKVTDSSGIEKVETEWKLYKKNNKVVISKIELKYNKGKKCYEGSVFLGKKYKKAVLDGITVCDIHGNIKYNFADKKHNPSLTKKLQKIVVIKK